MHASTAIRPIFGRRQVPMRSRVLPGPYLRLFMLTYLGGFAFFFCLFG